MMTPDEDEQAQRIADVLDAEHAAHLAAGNPPRVIDPGAGVALAVARGVDATADRA